MLQKGKMMQTPKWLRALGRAIPEIIYDVVLLAYFLFTVTLVIEIFTNYDMRQVFENYTNTILVGFIMYLIGGIAGRYHIYRAKL